MKKKQKNIGKVEARHRTKDMQDSSGHHGVAHHWCALNASTASSRCSARLYWACFSGRISTSRLTSLLVCVRGTRGQRSSLGSCSTGSFRQQYVCECEVRVSLRE